MTKQHLRPENVGVPVRAGEGSRPAVFPVSLNPFCHWPPPPLPDAARLAQPGFRLPEPFPQGLVKRGRAHRFLRLVSLDTRQEGLQVPGRVQDRLGRRIGPARGRGKPGRSALIGGGRGGQRREQAGLADPFVRVRRTLPEQHVLGGAVVERVAVVGHVHKGRERAALGPELAHRARGRPHGRGHEGRGPRGGGQAQVCAQAGELGLHLGPQQLGLGAPLPQLLGHVRAGLRRQRARGDDPHGVGREGQVAGRPGFARADRGRGAPVPGPPSQRVARLAAVQAAFVVGLKLGAAVRALARLHGASVVGHGKKAETDDFQSNVIDVD